MTYQVAIDWLFEQFPAYQKIGLAAYKPDLSNTLSLCKQLGIDYDSLKYIHIAGTNGKGSVSNMLASVFMEGGYRTGLFTSPHIHDFRERIVVDGVQIPEERVVAFCLQIQHLELEVKPSFFEITWALALTHFIESNCEMCIIETGLGGRLDSTNIIAPVLSVITNIGMDHVAVLGDTPAKIAFEKAGIIKEGTPVVIGETTPETLPVFTDKAEAVHADLYLAETLISFAPFVHTAGYQWKNERTVRMSLEVLSETGYPFTAETIAAGIEHTSRNTGFRGRFQVIANAPLTIVDAAHNEDGVRQLLETLKLHQQGKLHIVYGTSADKDLEAILSLFPKAVTFYLTAFSNQRSATTADLRNAAEALHLDAQIFHEVKQAISAAQLSADKDDTILITGSFFLMSDFF